jgi:PGF-CTERM protein
MNAKQLAIPIAVTVLILTLIPACALAAGGTISGKVSIPPNATLPEYINTTVDQNGVAHRDIIQKIDVTSLTIFAFNTQTGFANVTFPNADGTYSIPVSENGLYRIQVLPNEVIDLMNPSNWTLALYPNMDDRPYYVKVDGDVKNVDINYYPPGQYVAPNEMSAGTPTPKPSATATPTPGFAAVLVLAGILGAFAIVRRNK